MMMKLKSFSVNKIYDFAPILINSQDHPQNEKKVMLNSIVISDLHKVIIFRFYIHPYDIRSPLLKVNISFKVLSSSTLPSRKIYKTLN